MIKIYLYSVLFKSSESFNECLKRSFVDFSKKFAKAEVSSFHETRRVHLIRYLRFYYYRWFKTSEVIDLQLPVQSVPITTIVMSSNSADGEIYSIQHYVIKFVNDL